MLMRICKFCRSHHASIITLQATGCYKLIENQTGRAFMQIAQMTLVPKA
jgi:hypothetical protein